MLRDTQANRPQNHIHDDELDLIMEAKRQIGDVTILDIHHFERIEHSQNRKLRFVISELEYDKKSTDIQN